MATDKLKTGDIILFYLPLKWNNPMSWLAWLIRLIAKSKYNHAGVVVKYYNITFINEAIKIGVVSRLYNERLNNCKIKILRSYKSINEFEFTKKANYKVGAKYDYESLFAQLIFSIFGKWIGKRGTAANKRMYCYEYVAWVHGIKDSHKITPKYFEDTTDFFEVT